MLGNGLRRSLGPTLCRRSNCDCPRTARCPEAVNRHQDDSTAAVPPGPDRTVGSHLTRLFVCASQLSGLRARQAFPSCRPRYRLNGAQTRSLFMAQAPTMSFVASSAVPWRLPSLMARLTMHWFRRMFQRAFQFLPRFGPNWRAAHEPTRQTMSDANRRRD